MDKIHDSWLQPHRKYIQSTTGLAEKTVRPFLSSKAVMSSKPVNKTSYFFSIMVVFSDNLSAKPVVFAKTVFAIPVVISWEKFQASFFCIPADIATYWVPNRWFLKSSLVVDWFSLLQLFWHRPPPRPLPPHWTWIAGSADPYHNPSCPQRYHYFVVLCWLKEDDKRLTIENQ